jgi:hypothetical protein
MRSYVKAKEVFDTVPLDKRPKSRMLDLVASVKAAIAKEKIEAFRKKDEGE